MKSATELTPEMILEPDATAQAPEAIADSAAPVDYSFFRHRWMFWICVAVIVMAFLLEVRPDQKVAFRGWTDYPLPESCATLRVTGVGCPGCGLTRSFILIAEGNFAASFARHHLGWLLALAVVIQIPYRLYMMRRGPGQPSKSKISKYCSVTLIVLLIGNWLFGLIRL